MKLRLLKYSGIFLLFVFLILLFFTGFTLWYFIIVEAVFTDEFFKQAFYIVGLKFFGWAVLSLIVTVFCFSPFLVIIFYRPDDE